MSDKPRHSALRW